MRSAARRLSPGEPTPDALASSLRVHSACHVHPPRDPPTCFGMSTPQADGARNGQASDTAGCGRRRDRRTARAAVRIHLPFTSSSRRSPVAQTRQNVSGIARLRNLSWVGRSVWITKSKRDAITGVDRYAEAVSFIVSSGYADGRPTVDGGGTAGARVRTTWQDWTGSHRHRLPLCTLTTKSAVNPGDFRAHGAHSSMIPFRCQCHTPCNLPGSPGRHLSAERAAWSQAAQKQITAHQAASRTRPEKGIRRSRCRRMSLVYLRGVPRGIRPVVAAALGFSIRGMALVATGRAQ